MDAYSRYILRHTALACTTQGSALTSADITALGISAEDPEIPAATAHARVLCARAHRLAEITRQAASWTELFTDLVSGIRGLFTTEKAEQLSDVEVRDRIIGYIKSATHNYRDLTAIPSTQLASVLGEYIDSGLRGTNISEDQAERARISAIAAVQTAISEGAVETPLGGDISALVAEIASVHGIIISAYNDVVNQLDALDPAVSRTGPVKYHQTEILRIKEAYNAIYTEYQRANDLLTKFNTSLAAYPRLKNHPEVVGPIYATKVELNALIPRLNALHGRIMDMLATTGGGTRATKPIPESSPAASAVEKSTTAPTTTTGTKHKTADEIYAPLRTRLEELATRHHVDLSTISPAPRTPSPDDMRMILGNIAQHAAKFHTASARVALKELIASIPSIYATNPYKLTSDPESLTLYQQVVTALLSSINRLASLAEGTPPADTDIVSPAEPEQGATVPVAASPTTPTTAPISPTIPETELRAHPFTSVFAHTGRSATKENLSVLVDMYAPNLDKETHEALVSDLYRGRLILSMGGPQIAEQVISGTLPKLKALQKDPGKSFLQTLLTAESTAK